MLASLIGNANFKSAEISEIYQPTIEVKKLNKYMPYHAISPHWYDGTALDELVHHHIAAARQGKQDNLLLRDFVMTFKGLSGTQSVKKVTDQLPSIKHLSDFE